MRADLERLVNMRSQLKRQVCDAELIHVHNAAGEEVMGDSPRVAKLQAELESVEEQLQHVRERYAACMESVLNVD